MRACIAKIDLRSSFDGSVNINSRSNRPGRRKAGSIASILFVAPITTTWPIFCVMRKVEFGYNTASFEGYLDCLVHP